MCMRLTTLFIGSTNALSCRQQDKELGRAGQIERTALIREHFAHRQPLLLNPQRRRQILRPEEDPQFEEHRRHHRPGDLCQKKCLIPRCLPSSPQMISQDIHIHPLFHRFYL